MKKEEIFVRIDSEEKRLKAIQILTDAVETIWSFSDLTKEHYVGSLLFDKGENNWFLSNNDDARMEITLDQLEQRLTTNYTVKEVRLTFDELREQAEKLGFELVEKKREIKVGDFGGFWDDDNAERVYFNFIHNIKNGWFFDKGNLYWQNFRHLTDEEKQKIKENW